MGETLHELERADQADHAAGDYWAQARANEFRDRIQQHNFESVLDIGCGSGYLTSMIADMNIEYVKGIDISPDSIQLAKTRDTMAEFEQADIFDYEFERCWDCIILADVIEHFETPVKLLQYVQNGLSGSGVVIVSVPAFNWLFGHHDEHNGHYTRYNRRLLSDVANDAGYTLQYTNYTNFVPLAPYFVYQRILKQPVPDGTRGEHNSVLEMGKSLLLSFEGRNPIPLGVTLVGELHEE